MSHNTSNLARDQSRAEPHGQQGVQPVSYPETRLHTHEHCCRQDFQNPVYNIAREYAGVFPVRVAVMEHSQRVFHDCDSNRSSRAEFVSARRGRVICSSFVSVTTSLVIKHTCSIVPPLRSRRKCFQESPGRPVIEDASRGGLVTSMYWRRCGLPSMYKIAWIHSNANFSMLASSSCF